MPTIKTLTVSALLLLSSTVAQAQNPHASAEAVNQAAPKSAPKAPAVVPPRLVVAGGGLTEILYAIGAQQHIAGVDTTSTYPADAKNHPSIGYMRMLSTEGVLSLKPDYLLTTSAVGPEKVLQVLKAAGVNIHELNGEDSFAGLLARVAELGKITAQTQAAADLIAKLKRQKTQLDADIQKANYAPKVLFLLTHGGSAPRSAGSNTAPDGLIQLIGAQNAARDFSGYKILGQEAIAALQPDVILTSEQGLAHMGGMDAFIKSAGVSLTPAGKHRRIVVMDLNLLNFGPRLIEGAQKLRQDINALR